MEDNVGTIVIGTKVDKKGLEKGLQEAEQIINKAENKEVKISYDGSGTVEVAGQVWEKLEAGNEALYKQWHNAQYTKEELAEIEKMTAEINAKSEDQLKDESVKRGEYYKQLEALQEQKILQEDLARYNETQARLLAENEIPELTFDVGINEDQFDDRLKELQFRAESIGRDISQATDKRDEIIGNIAELEKEIGIFEREHQIMLQDALEYERLNELKAQGVQLSEQEENALNGLQKRAGNLQEISMQYEKLINAQVKAEESLQNNSYRVEELTWKYKNLVKKAQEYTEVSDNGGKGFSKMNIDMGKISNGFTKLVKKAGMLALALIGIRTIMNLITRSFNTLSQYNEELGTKMEQMRLVLAVALEPVINWIVSMLQVILSLVNQIMSSLFGLNLFGRASELWSKKMAKNMSKGAGSAKEMKKQLAGFDEMNVLNDNQASGGGGGASEMDPWMLEDKPIPGWMQWILKNGSLIAGIIAGIGTALLLLNLGVSGLLALGIGVLVAGIVMLIMDIINYLKDPTWENFGNIIRDIGIILIGIGIIIGGIPGLVVAIIGAIVLLVGEIIKYWDQIKGWIQGIADWFHQKGEEFKKNGNKFLGGIFELIGNYVEDIIDTFEWLVDIVKTLFDGIIDFIKKVFAGDWEGAWESIKDTFGKIWDKIKEIASKTWERLKENVKIFIDAVVDLHNKLVLWLAEKILGIYNYVKGIIDSIVNWIVNKFNIVMNFFKGIGIAIGDFFSGAIKGAVNGALSWVESKVNWFIDKINGVISLINKIPGVSIGKLSRISLPRLATGGIINQPGRGVPVGGAIAGESGREGILPLTDRQAMAELGREIGKWISIQATVPVNIGNRQVARVIQELNNDREFAMNS